MGNQTAESKRINETGAEAFGLEISKPKVDTTEVLELNYQKAFASFSEEDKQKVIALANSIDLKQIENVMNYGASPFISTFDQCGEFLKKERGSAADQKVIKEVIELSKKAMSSNEDFGIMLKEPNAIQKIFLKAFYKDKKSNTQKIKNAAITTYQLLGELKKSYSSWMEILKEAMGEIEYSAITDIDAITLLEKYIIAGKIAEERIKGELDEIEARCQETGVFSIEYEKMKEGYEIFNRRMGNLEDARIMYRLSISEIMLVGRSNRNTQEAINTQAQITITVIAMQLRNALLNEKVKEVLEGHKAITKLGDELIKEISRNIGCTAEQTEIIIYAAICNPNATKEAVENILKSCETIQNTAEEMEPKIKATREQCNMLIEKLNPIVNSAVDSTEALKTKNTHSLIKGELTF